MEQQNIFNKLNKIDVSDKIEKKNNLSYLSWAWAWAEVKKLYPMANYKVYEQENGTIYWTDGKTCWVKTGVIIEDLEHIEYLPVMDFKNKSISLENITSFDVNKTIQRSLTKALARHGLGLYIYAGEDLPETDKPVVDARLKELAEENNINLEKYAKYIKKSVSDLTEEDIENAITQKQKKLVEKNGN